MALHNNIENLIEKYFEASTTAAEEQILKRYFAQEKVAAHLEQYRPMFAYFSMAKNEKYPKQEALNPSKNIRFKWLSIAAAVILFFGCYFGNQYYEKQQARLAYQETKAALNLLAQNFNKGKQKMVYLNQFEATQQKLLNDN